MKLERRGPRWPAPCWVLSASWKWGTLTFRGPQGHTCQISYQLKSFRKEKSMIKNRPKGQRQYQMSFNWFWEIICFAKQPQLFNHFGLTWDDNHSPDVYNYNAAKAVIMISNKARVYTICQSLSRRLDVNNWFEKTASKNWLIYVDRLNFKKHGIFCHWIFAL